MPQRCPLLQQDTFLLFIEDFLYVLDAIVLFVLEYAIADTFGEDNSADRKYVLVDKDTGGSFSVSEGNLVSYHHFGSEAAANHSSVVERHSSEAGLNDVAFTGDSLNNFEREAGSPVDKVQGTDAMVNDAQLEKSEEKKKVTLVVQANPFYGDDDDDDDDDHSETEDSVEDREVSIAHQEELPTPVPPKPIRGILRSRDDINKVSTGEEILPEIEDRKRFIEPNVSDQTTVEKHSECKHEVSFEVSKEDTISASARLQKEVMPNVEINIESENETWKEEFHMNSHSASPVAAQPREIAESPDTSNSQEIEYGELERRYEVSSEDIVNFHDDANVNADIIDPQDADNIQDLEETDEISFDQMTENKGDEEVAAGEYLIFIIGETFA